MTASHKYQAQPISTSCKLSMDGSRILHEETRKWSSHAIQLVLCAHSPAYQTAYSNVFLNNDLMHNSSVILVLLVFSLL